MKFSPCHFSAAVKNVKNLLLIFFFCLVVIELNSMQPFPTSVSHTQLLFAFARLQPFSLAFQINLLTFLHSPDFHESHDSSRKKGTSPYSLILH